MRLKIGEKAPDFELTDEKGSTVSLSDYHGTWVLLYFYPEDKTPGCTKEAKAFQDLHSKFVAKGVVVFGVSTDSPESHSEFKEKSGLSLSLLSDEGGEVSDLYNIFDEENGRAKRVSFLINSLGILKKTYNDVDPGNHAKEVLEDLEALQED